MIGLFGGTFDPVHWGHLRLATRVQRELKLSEIRWIPLNQAVHKDQPIADAAQRVSMVQAAIQDNPGFCIDTCELRRGGPSFMVDTLTDIQASLPDETFCLIVGADALAHFSKWKQPQRILQLAHIVGVQRPGCAFNPPPWLAAHCCTRVADLHQQTAGLIYQQTMTPSTLASTTIRQALIEQRDVQTMLPTPVLAFIQHHNLYRPNTSPNPC